MNHFTSWVFNTQTFFKALFEARKILRKENGEENKEEKLKGKKTLRKIKNRCKVNKLILYVYLKSFYLFISII